MLTTTFYFFKIAKEIMNESFELFFFVGVMIQVGEQLKL